MRTKGGQEGGKLSVQVSRTVAIEVCLLFNFAVVFIINVFQFPPSKAKYLGESEIEVHLAPIDNTV
jgi:hypothetical protein